jgi:hypothetical protein
MPNTARRRQADAGLTDTQREADRLAAQAAELATRYDRLPWHVRRRIDVLAGAAARLVDQWDRQRRRAPR